VEDDATGGKKAIPGEGDCPQGTAGKRSMRRDGLPNACVTRAAKTLTEMQKRGEGFVFEERTQDSGE